jgi:predicted metallo-beta-lactamase superfamily hydrolase
MPLAADSLGTRSMATYVEAGRLRLLLDPGATLAPRRFGLEPAPEEEEALARARLRIEGWAVRATHVAVSHFHTDHYGADPKLYAGRLVWAKDPRRMIDPHQAAQGRDFWRAVGPQCRLEPAEGRTIELDGATVRFSPALPHGLEGSAFGYVVAVTVDDGERFVHASDLQGPASPVATAYPCASARTSSTSPGRRRTSRGRSARTSCSAGSTIWCAWSGRPGAGSSWTTMRCASRASATVSARRSPPAGW